MTNENMTGENKSNFLIAAIIIGALLISGSLVFLGLQMTKDKGLSGEDLQTEIFKGIDSYIQTEQKKAAEAQAEAEKPKFVEGDFTDDDPVMGDKDAPVTIVEFSDYQCPFCAAFYNGALPDIKKKYIDTGKVKLIYRDYPLSSHPEAYPAALLAECVDDLADDEIYFKVHDEIFETIADGFKYDSLSKFAGGLGVDEAKLKKCFDSDEFKDEIYADQKDGEKAGVSGTPGFLVNGWLISGAQEFSKFEEVIEKELAK